jgi:hypothetical protein
VLDVTKSTYFPSFNRLCAEVSAARVEANNNVNYLSPLVRYLERLNMSDEFPALVEQFKPIMHLLLLVWKHSRYYNSAARLVVLIREVCNDLINQATTFLGGAEILVSLSTQQDFKHLIDGFLLNTCRILGGGACGGCGQAEADAQGVRYVQVVLLRLQAAYGC